MVSSKQVSNLKQFDVPNISVPFLVLEISTDLCFFAFFVLEDVNHVIKIRKNIFLLKSTTEIQNPSKHIPIQKNTHSTFFSSIILETVCWKMYYWNIIPYCWGYSVTRCRGHSRSTACCVLWRRSCPFGLVRVSASVCVCESAWVVPTVSPRSPHLEASFRGRPLAHIHTHSHTLWVTLVRHRFLSPICLPFFDSVTKHRETD